MRTEETFSVEVDKMRRVVGAPDFGLPGNIRQILPHLLTIGEARDVHQSGGRLPEQRCKLAVPLRMKYPQKSSIICLMRTFCPPGLNVSFRPSGRVTGMRLSSRAATR